MGVRANKIAAIVQELPTSQRGGAPSQASGSLTMEHLQPGKAYQLVEVPNRGANMLPGRLMMMSSWLTIIRSKPSSSITINHP